MPQRSPCAGPSRTHQSIPDTTVALRADARPAAIDEPSRRSSGTGQDTYSVTHHREEAFDAHVGKPGQCRRRSTHSVARPRTRDSLSPAVAALSQSLHQLAAFHDAPAKEAAWVAGDTNASRAARYAVSWDLHRAAEILRHVGESIDHAHSAESGVTYVHRDFPAFADSPTRSAGQGLSL